MKLSILVYFTFLIIIPSKAQESEATCSDLRKEVDENITCHIFSRKSKCISDSCTGFSVTKPNRYLNQIIGECNVLYLDCGLGKLKFKDLEKINKSLISLRLSGGCRITGETSLVFSNLQNFNVHAYRFPRIPEYLSLFPKLKVLSIETKDLSGLEYIPNSVECLTFFIHDYKSFSDKSSRLFELSSLKRLTIFTVPYNSYVDFPRINGSSGLEYLKLPLDLGSQKNVERLKRLQNLKTLIVKDFSSDNYSILEQLSHVRNIVFTDIESKVFSEIKKRFNNVSML